MDRTRRLQGQHAERTMTLDPVAAGAYASELPELPCWSVQTRVDSVGADARSTEAAYTLLAPIGEGGMGEVWEARQASLGRVVAVKRLRRDQAAGANKRAQLERAFRHEAAVAAALEHPHILPVYDLGRDADGALLLAMKRIHGDCWDALLESDYPQLDVDAFLDRHLPILADLSQAVAFAHARGIVHRDLKPAQVLVGEYGEVLLTDWGLALRIGESPEALLQAVATPAQATGPAGTPALMAPEQTDGDGRRLGPWTDVYLLGAILYRLLCGSYPHAAESATAAIALARTGQITAPSARAPTRQIPPELESLCLRALAVEPAERVASAREFHAAIEDFRQGSARKAQAAVLLDEARQKLAAPHPDYGDYANAVAALEEARRLWPQGLAVQALRERALLESARLALARGDLRLARSQAEALADGEERLVLLTALRRAEETQQRRRRQLRMAQVAIMLLLALVAAGGGWFSLRMQAANIEIVRQRDRAVDAETMARLRAEEAEAALAIASQRGAAAFQLIDFILRDLKAALDAELTVQRNITLPMRNTIAHGIAGKIATPVVSYLQELSVDDWPLALQREHGEQLLAVGGRFRELARIDEAERLLQSAVALHARDPEADPLREAALLTALATLAQQAGRLREAEPQFRRALALREQVLAADDPQLSRSLVNLAALLLPLAQLEEAEALYRRAIAGAQASATESDPSLGVALAGLASVLGRTGRDAEAETLLRRALDQAETELGREHSSVAIRLNSLAFLLRKLGREAEAEAAFRRAITILEGAEGPEHPNVALGLTNLALLLRDQRQLDEAERLLRRANAILRAAYGNDHPSYGRNLRGLGSVLALRGRTGEADRLLRQALAILEAALGAEHPDTVSARSQLQSVSQQPRGDGR